MLLQYSHDCSLMYCLWLICATIKKLSSYNTNRMALRALNIYIWLLTEEICKFYSVINYPISKSEPTLFIPYCTNTSKSLPQMPCLEILLSSGSALPTPQCSSQTRLYGISKAHIIQSQTLHPTQATRFCIPHHS